jgi:hypothetical protein
MSLLGTWKVDPTDAGALADLGDVRLDFKEDGRLTYTVRGKTKNEIIILTYRVEGATIVTNQPSAPRVERTAYSLSSAEC